MPNPINELLNSLIIQSPIKGLEKYQELGEQANLLSPKQKMDILEYLKNNYGFEAPLEKGSEIEMVNNFSAVDPSGTTLSGQFAVNRPGGPKPLPFPSTSADYERSLKGQMADLYTESEQTKISDTVSQMAKRKYEADQSELAKQFATEFGQIGMAKGLMNIGPEDIGQMTNKYSRLDPLTVERIVGNYGLNPKESLKEQKKNFAFKNISDFQTQKKGDLTKDLGFWTDKVFPYVDAGDAFAMLRHFTPSAGTKDKTTLNDIEASLVQRFLKGEDFNDRELVVLSNIALRFNPLVKMTMDYYLDAGLMSRDPAKKSEAMKKLNGALRDSMRGWFLEEEPTTTPVSKPPLSKIKADQVPQGGAPREKRPIATHIYNPATGRVEEVR